jgi:hypothetical protein
MVWYDLYVCLIIVRSGTLGCRVGFFGMNLSLTCTCSSTCRGTCTCIVPVVIFFYLTARSLPYPYKASIPTHIRRSVGACTQVRHSILAVDMCRFAIPCASRAHTIGIISRLASVFHKHSAGLSSAPLVKGRARILRDLKRAQPATAHYQHRSHYISTQNKTLSGTRNTPN